MEVEVKLKCRSIIALQLHGEFIQGSDLREDMFVEFVKLPVEVLATEARTKIASNHSIGVEHRHHIKHKAFSYDVASWIIRSKESD